jgi:putative ABC transport system ATP-binding protein
MTDVTILAANDLTRSYRTGERDRVVLQRVSFAIHSGETAAIVGPSGSGKSTLLALCAGLDVPSSGRVELAGFDLATLDEDERAALRLSAVGFVFQSFRLIPTLTALENVMVPRELLGRSDATSEARRLLESVGLGDRVDHYPSQLSGGEQQRVAIARAFVNEPRILFADEPTGNLDTRTGTSVIDHLFTLNRERGTTLMLVTHDENLARRTGRTLTLHGGELVADQRNPEPALAR